MKMPPVPGKIFILPKDGPICPKHKGHMKLREQMDLYVCKGFDGEGCDYTIMMETMLIEIGTTDGPVFEV